MSAGRGIVVCRVDPFVVVFDVAAAVGAAAVGAAAVGAAAVGTAAGVAVGFVSLGSEMDSSNNRSIAIGGSADSHFHVCYSASIRRH